MAASRKRTHKFITPVIVEGEKFLDVYRKDPKTKKTVYVHRHKTVEQCCKALRHRFHQEKKKFSPSKLRLAAPRKVQRKRLEKIKYIGVTPLVRSNGKKVWKVQKKFDTESWYYETQEAAASAIAKSLRVAPSVIQHQKPRLPMLPRCKLRAIHSPAMSLYSGKKPGDLENLEAHATRKETWKYLKEYPGVLPSFMISKIALPRDSIIRSCAALSAKTKKKSPLVKAKCEAYYHYSILAAAAKEICRYRWSETERLHVGRNNYHWMNFQNMLHRLGILVQNKNKATGKRRLFFTNTGTYYYLCSWNENIGDNLRTHITWGRRCLSLCTKIPSTANDYYTATRTLDKDMEPLVGAQDSTGYLRMWLQRAWMLFLLKAYNRNINFAPMTVGKFMELWPDEHNLLFGLLSDERLKTSDSLNISIGKALLRLDFKDKPELLSMHACLVDDHDAQTILREKDSKWIERNIKEMKKRLIAWRRRERMWPHPGIFFPSCKDLK